MKHYLVDPFGDPANANKIFQSPYGVLKELFKKRDVQLDTYDLGDLAHADKVLFFNYNEAFYQKCIAAGVTLDKMALFAYEPEVVIPIQYRQDIWDQFGSVFTFLDDRIDNERVFKFRFPQAQTPVSPQPPWEKRKFLILMNANKYSYIKNELYSWRRKAIRYFEQSNASFDLYGYLWDKGSSVIGKGDMIQALRHGRIFQFIYDYIEGLNAYPSYRGSVDDKYATMAKYKFALCFENEKGVNGYLTEKIFDAFVCGTVPVYWGANNITDYIPADCFIDYRNFKNFAELEAFLNSITKEQWLGYQKAIKKYLASDAFKEWTPKVLFQTFVDVLAPKNGKEK